MRRDFKGKKCESMLRMGLIELMRRSHIEYRKTGGHYSFVFQALRGDSEWGVGQLLEKSVRKLSKHVRKWLLCSGQKGG